jgi:hypothetical protein
MKTKIRLTIAALVTALVASLAAFAPAAHAACSHFRGVDDVTVRLLTAAGDPEDRREHIFLSETLADQLGIGPYDSTPLLNFTPNADVNPQVRVIIETPQIDGRKSSAVFTVAGVFAYPVPSIRVYGNLNSSDKNSGQFKLFKDTGTADVDLTETSANGDIRDVEARVIIRPTSKSTVEEDGVATVDEHFCEPTVNSPNGFVERSLITDDKRFALLVPHGGAIEVKTSDQIAPIVSQLDAADVDVQANLWEVSGTWPGSLGQTYPRWHVTGSAVMPESFPALEELLSRADFATGVPFQYAAALHGYDSNDLGVILGGRADRAAKCLVVRRIQDELLTSRDDETEIGFFIHDMEGNIEIANTDGDIPTNDTGYSAQNVNELVNRLSPNASGVPGRGGIQLEQSSAVRTDETDGQEGSGTSVRDHWLRFVVARGLARAVEELIAGTAPANVCNQYLQ